MVDVVSVILRALSFVLLLQAAGVAIFLAVFGRRLAEARSAVLRLGEGAAVAGLVLVAGNYVLEAARMAGELSGVWDPTLQGMLWHSSGAALIFRLAGLALIAVELQRTRGRGSTLATLGAVLACLAFTLTGHTTVAPSHRAILASLLMIHLLVVAFWFGALGPLYLASSREPSGRAFALVEAFTVVATPLVPVILLTGVTMAAVLLPSLSALREPYGELLIAKVAGFAVLMGVAAANKWRLGPALAGGTAESGRRFRRAVAAEYVLIVGVLAVTAVMTTFYSPDGAR